MDSFIGAISDFINSVMAIALVGGGLILFAGEIRLAADQLISRCSLLRGPIQFIVPEWVREFQSGTITTATDFQLALKLTLTT